MRKKVAIVIPTYVEKLNHNEEISLHQCRCVLEKYDRFFIAPEGLNIPYVQKETIIYEDADKLSSRKSYSDYVLSLDFYKQFLEYKYILIYQLDAFVFCDALEKFYEMGYDYFGAPWINGLECHCENESLWYVGNGGFSLRKVDAFIRWLKEDNEKIEYYKMLLLEDMIIAVYGKNNLSIAPIDICLQFAFDLNPSTCYEKNQSQLPFGCHCWHRFENDFWKPIIGSYGYTMEELAYVDEEAELLNSGKHRHELMEQCLDTTIIHECLKDIIKEYAGEIYVFGSGKYGLSFLNIVKGTDVKILGYVDNDINKIGQKISDYKIVSPVDLKSEDVVLVALARPEKVAVQLTKMGKIHGKSFATAHDLQIKMIEWNGRTWVN